MARFQYVQTRFTAGEISPRIRGRLDFDEFYGGADEIFNYIVQPHGGVTRRPGTRFVGPVKDDADFTRLLPFSFSTEQTYIIEAGDLYFRFYRDGGQVQDAGSPVEVVTPYTSAQLPLVKFAQSADVLFLVGPDNEPKELHRNSDISWSLVDFDFRDGPYLDVNVEDTTLALSGTTGSVTVTASAVTGINDDQGFLSTDVGRLIRWQDPATNWTWLEITAFTDTTHVTALIRGADASAGTATTEWRLGAWSDTTGWPSVITFHQERLWFAATASAPQSLWSSKTSDFDNFAPSDPDGTVADDAAITLTIASNQVDAIRWLFPQSQGLVVGTSDAEAVVKGSGTEPALTPSNVAVTFQTGTGSSTEDVPVRVGHAALFIQRGSTVFNELAFNFNVDGFEIKDVSIIAEHLLRSGVADPVYQQNPAKIIWMANFDGQLLGFSIEREQKVLAWHHHEIGGSFNGLPTIVDDLAVIQEGAVDQVWLIVRRDVDGTARRHIEFIETQFDSTTEETADAFYVDSGLTGDEVVATDTWTGLDHLEGETVSVLADGAAHPDVVVSSGTVVLGRLANKIQVGLGYTSRVTTMPFEIGQEGQSTVGTLKRAPRVYVRFIDTIGARVAQQGSTIDIIPFGPGPMNAPPELFSGTKEASLSGSRTFDIQVTVEQTQPLPSTVINIGILVEFASA